MTNPADETIQVCRLYEPDVPRAVIRELWDYLSDDSDASPDDFEPRLDESSRWYVSIEDDEIVGVYWLRRINHLTWEAHTNIRKQYWGTDKGLPHTKEALRVSAIDTEAEKIITIVPEFCKQVLALTEKLGFELEGRRVGSFQKNGKTFDEIYLGISRNRIYE
jgi:RimJ/RimL family protein N-acetyltransferase